MAREIQITPRRLQYARQTEADLFSSVMSIADSNQQHMSQLVKRTCSSMREELLDQAARHQFRGGPRQEGGLSVAVMGDRLKGERGAEWWFTLERILDS